jgi:glycosyltransferase involved in cell wall biosynthesis
MPITTRPLGNLVPGGSIRTSPVETHPSTLIVHSTSSPYAGTTRMALYLAQGFADCGHDVTLAFVDLKPSNDLLPLDRTAAAVRFLSGRLSKSLSKAIQAPFFRLFESGAFDENDSIDVFGQVVGRGLRQLVASSDNVILMNQWAGFSFLLNPRPRRARVGLIIHEPPYFRELPALIRAPLRRYIDALSRAVDVIVSISPVLQARLASDFGIASVLQINAVAPEPNSLVRGNFVLVNTRWTIERDPGFIVDIARLNPGVKFVVVGRFATSELRERLRTELSAAGLTGQVEIFEDVSEDKLATLFSTARCYLRWAACGGELGVSAGLFQAIGSGCVPVISDDLGSAYEVRTQISPDLVVPRTPEAFAVAVARLIRDDHFLDTMMKRVLQYRENHTWKQYAQQLLNELDST